MNHITLSVVRTTDDAIAVLRDVSEAFSCSDSCWGRRPAPSTRPRFRLGCEHERAWDALETVSSFLRPQRAGA